MGILANTLTRTLAAMFLVCSAAGCVFSDTMNDYVRDRGRDLSDCVRASAGVGLGVHARANTWFFIPVGAGASYTREFGWDGGTGIGRATWYRFSSTFTLFCLGWADFDAVMSEPLDSGGGAQKPLPEDAEFVFHGEVATMNSFRMWYRTHESAPPERGEDGVGPDMFWLGLDATAGVVSGRLGVRPHEVLDACLGLFSIDICRDDRRQRHHREDDYVILTHRREQEQLTGSRMNAN